MTTTEAGCEAYRVTRKAMRQAMARLYAEAQVRMDINPYEVHSAMVQHRIIADAMNILMEEDFT